MLLIKELVMPVRGLTQISFHASKRQQIITFPPKGVINFSKHFYLGLHNILIKQGNKASVKNILNIDHRDYFFISGYKSLWNKATSKRTLQDHMCSTTHIHNQYFH